MNSDQLTREYRSCHAASLDAEVRAIRLAKVADSITSGMSLGHLDEVMRGLVVDRMFCAAGEWTANVHINRPMEPCLAGMGSTLAEALADAVRSLARMYSERAAEKRKMAARWLTEMEVENG